MTPEEMSAKMAALFEDEAFTAKAAACENTEQMAELFVKEGLPVTSDMLDALLAKANEEELDEGALDNVAGGATVGVWGMKRGLGGVYFKPIVLKPIDYKKFFPKK